MEVLGDKKHQKNIYNYNCQSCDFKCIKKGDWNRHINRAKHLKLTQTNNLGDEGDTKNIFSCNICNKIYTSRNGLWKHKKVCENNDININNLSNVKEISDKELILKLLKQNSELMEQNTELMGLLKNNTTNQISHNMNSLNNNNNKTFNLQFFLNETCKNAMNITDFIDSIKLQLSDLESIGEVGYIEGISNIINKKLCSLDVTQRPIHCADKKREVIYVKDENKWDKEDEDKKQMRKLIKNVSNKNIKLINKFKEVHPDCGKSNSKYSDQYNQIIIEAMGGKDFESTKEKEDKIIKNISKNVVIDKEK